MQPLALLTALRTLINSNIQECLVQEYKPEVIVKMYTQKLQNIKNSITSNKELNRKVQSKYLQAINNAQLPASRVKSYESVRGDLSNSLSTLPSAIEFMKKN